MIDKLKNLKEHIAQGKHAMSFDVSRFNDPMAEQIQWTPLQSGGSSFAAQNLTEINPDRFELKPTLQSKLFSFVFMGVGVAIPLFFIPDIDFADEDAMLSLGFLSIFGLLFAASGFFTLRKFSKPTVFDKSIGKFWKGKNGPDKKPELMNSELVYDLDKVYAIQLLSEYVRSDKKSYYIFELNFVMDDTKRLNILRQGGKAKIRKNADTLSKFLNIPIWDAAG